MKLKDIVNLLTVDTRWVAVSAKTGKKLCDINSSREFKDKYMDNLVTDKPIFVRFKKTEDYCVPFLCESVTPVLAIWTCED